MYIYTFTNITLAAKNARLNELHEIMSIIL